MKKKKSANRDKELYKEKHLEDMKKRYPNLCFCDKPIYTEEDYLGETDKVHYAIDDRACEHPFSYPKYMCKTCGKLYIEKKVKV